MLLKLRKKLISALVGKMPICMNVTVLENSKMNKNSKPSVGLSPSDDGKPLAVFTRNVKFHRFEETQ